MRGRIAEREQQVASRHKVLEADERAQVAAQREDARRILDEVRTEKEAKQLRFQESRAQLEESERRAAAEKQRQAEEHAREREFFLARPQSEGKMRTRGGRA